MNHYTEFPYRTSKHGAKWGVAPLVGSPLSDADWRRARGRTFRETICRMLQIVRSELSARVLTSVCNRAADGRRKAGRNRTKTRNRRNDKSTECKMRKGRAFFSPLEFVQHRGQAENASGKCGVTLEKKSADRRHGMCNPLAHSSASLEARKI